MAACQMCTPPYIALLSGGLAFHSHICWDLLDILLSSHSLQRNVSKPSGAIILNPLNIGSLKFKIMSPGQGALSTEKGTKGHEDLLTSRDRLKCQIYRPYHFLLYI